MRLGGLTFFTFALSVAGSVDNHSIEVLPTAIHLEQKGVGERGVQGTLHRHNHHSYTGFRTTQRQTGFLLKIEGMHRAAQSDFLKRRRYQNKQSEYEPFLE